MTCDLSMKKFLYNKILCDICGVKDNNETSAAQQSVSGFCYTHISIDLIISCMITRI